MEFPPQPSVIARFLPFALFFHNTGCCPICCAKTTGCVIITACHITEKTHTSSSDSNLQWISNCCGMGRQLLAGSSKAAPKQDVAFMIHKSCSCVLGMYFTYRKSTMCSDCSSMQGSGVHLSHLLNVLLYTMSLFCGAVIL